MAQRKSPRRIQKQQRVAAIRSKPHQAFAQLGAPREAIEHLESCIVGCVVLPGDPDYDKDRLESNPVFQAFPQVIVYCEVTSDIECCLSVAISYGTPIAIRSGGHSTAGYSVNNGIVIDVSLLNGISINSTAMTATVGPGVDFDRFNAALSAAGLHVPTGACGNVCVGGFMQGGGFGYTSRNFGMNCDNVTEVVVMLWNGGTVRANATQNEDLFWAVRGGTGGNFGVLVEVTYALQPLASVWAYAIQWDISQAAVVLLELQANYARSGAPPQLGYMMNVGFNDTTPVAMIQGMYCGSADDGKQAIASLLAIPTAQLLVDQTGTYGDMDKYLDDNPYPMPNPTGIYEDKICGYVNSPLSLSDWQAIVDQVLLGPGTNCVLYTEPYGGAINAFPADGNAFVHRDVDMNIVLDAFWTDPAGKIAAEQWLFGFQQLMEPYFCEEVYQNYPRASYDQFRMLYWGTAFFTLLDVKRKYDPNNIFRYEQSISPYPEGAKRPAASASPRFAERPIVYELPPKPSKKKP
jgi:FAD/FMN-containing dehydrogenase